MMQPKSRLLSLEPEDSIEALQSELNAIEGREFELLALSTSIVLIVCPALVVALQPRLLWDFNSFLRQSDYAPQLVLGLFVLVLLLVAYLYHERRLLRFNRRELLRQLLIVERTAQLDPLTGAFNRRCLDRLLLKEINRAVRKSTNLSLVIVDVDDFKAFNTDYGHVVGDQILTQVANVLVTALRASDTVIRYGGDEFILLLGDTDYAQAQIAMQRIAEYLQAWNQKAERELRALTVTCGAAEYDGGMSPDDLIKKADQAMLGKKSHGSGRGRDK
jgi:diguanylate cyclase (GGDEF)-like protein